MLVTRLGADSLNISPTCRPASHPSAGHDRSREQPMVSTSSGVRKLGNSWWQLAAAGLPASVTSQPQRGQVVHLHLYLPGPHLQPQHLVVFNHPGRITWPQNLVLNHLTTYQDPTAIWMGGKTFYFNLTPHFITCWNIFFWSDCRTVQEHAASILMTDVQLLIKDARGWILRNLTFLAKWCSILSVSKFGSEVLTLMKSLQRRKGFWRFEWPQKL